jgi:hypothetical protein
VHLRLTVDIRMLFLPDQGILLYGAYLSYYNTTKLDGFALYNPETNCITAFTNWPFLTSDTFVRQYNTSVRLYNFYLTCTRVS